MNKHFLIVLNPLPNKRKQYWLAWLIEQLKSHRKNYYLYTTSKVLADNQLFFKNHLHKYDEVVVLGGDGTLHLIANCMAYASQAITILPCGTGNDFARNFNYTRQQTKQLLFSEKSQLIDLGKVNNRYFINSAGVGFDAEIVKKTSGHKRFLARFSYLYYATISLLCFREQSLELMQGINKQQFDNFLTVFANGKFFGGGMKIAPEATLSSHQLVRYSVDKAPLYKKLWSITRIYAGTHTALNEVSSHPFSKLTLITENLPIQADGELVGLTPACIAVAPRALKIKVL